MRLVLLSLLLAGCAANTWSKPGASSQDFYDAEDQCQAQSERSSQKGPVNWSDFDACMRNKGWSKAKS
jgi:hypothetical protein